MKNSKNNKTQKLVTTAVLIALSTVLSMIKVFQAPLGGSITLMSMLPLCLISIMYGTAWAIAPCLLYGAIQMLLGNPFGWGLTPQILVGCILFDYIFAFGVLCFAGIFRKKGVKGIVCGITLASLLRFISHTFSGVVFFKNLEQFKLFGELFVNRPLLYSICYNGLYMLPELVITAVCAAILFKAKPVKEFLLAER